MNRTYSATLGAEDLGMEEQDVVDVVAALSMQDFDKSMRSEVDPSIWQDVYLPVANGREIYVKFTLDRQGDLLLISFKDNSP